MHSGCKGIFWGVVLWVFLLGFSVGVGAGTKTPSFTGVIQAQEVYKSGPIRNKKKIEYTVSSDTIQRVRFESRDSFKGVKVSPKSDEAILFYQDSRVKLYTKMSMADYVAYLEKLIKKRDKIHRKSYGASYYFKYARWKGLKKVINTEDVVQVEGRHCDKYSHLQKDKKQLISLISCENLVDRNLFRYTELYMPESISGFPLEFEFSYTQSKERTSDRFKKSLGSAKDKLSKTGRFMTGKVEYFKYRVRTRKAYSIAAIAFVDLSKFKYVASLGLIKKLADQAHDAEIEAKRKIREDRGDDGIDGIDIIDMLD
ncbi:MAG: hypothetical protein K6L81_12540 [Agarilytica sp.]